ncbi:MAG: formylglycine-generating enzyme family protein [Myxococcales bacterium]|nr:formylglycine-generating enzyme family protein [Myxococcales bacterium]
MNGLGWWRGDFSGWRFAAVVALSATLGAANATAQANSAPAVVGGPAVLSCGTPSAGMACIAGGAFIRGSDDGPANAKPQATVWVQTFWMDLYEVTYAEYKACEKKGKCPKSGPKYSDFNRPKQAINGVSWHDAVAYCGAHGKRLPTEAEWEKAARGTQGALHPWGNEPATCKRAVIMDKTGRSCGVKKLHSQPDKGRVLEVGSRPAGAYGLFDMSGNSWEWVADWYSPSYAKCGSACAGVDPKGPCGGKATCAGYHEKLVRGGSWYWPAQYATAIWRRPHAANNEPFHHFGFRCAASVPATAGGGR